MEINSNWNWLILSLINSIQIGHVYVQHLEYVFTTYKNRAHLKTFMTSTFISSVSSSHNYFFHDVVVDFIILTFSTNWNTNFFHNNKHNSWNLLATNVTRTVKMKRMCCIAGLSHFVTKKRDSIMRPLSGNRDIESTSSCLTYSQLT